MRTRRNLFVLPLLAATSFALGCGDSGSGSPTGPTAGSGSVSFNFTGAVSGNYSASGAVQVNQITGAQFGTWAAGGREGGELAVVAFRARTNPRGDFFGLFVEGITGPRTVSITEDCETNCAEVVFVTNMSITGTDQTFERICVLLTGSVTVSSISAQRAQGTFSGQGECVNMAFEEEPFAITNGTFDVPIVQGLEF
jgi:hypothetical protein